MEELPQVSHNSENETRETRETLCDAKPIPKEAEPTFTYDDLKYSHKLFVDAYRLERNAGRAARKAGFSPKGAAASGARLLRRADVGYVVNHPNGPDIDQGTMTEEDFDRLLTAFAKGQGQQALPALKLLGERRGWIKKQQDDAQELPMNFAADQGE